jgi:hypothetical protein
MHMLLIPSLANSEDHQLHVHPTRARRFVDHLTGDRTRDNRADDAGNTRPGRPPKDAPIRQGQCQTGWGPSQMSLQTLTRAILLLNIYTESR